MVSQTHVAHADRPAVSIPSTEQIYQEGIVAGMLGAVTIAVWFLFIDLLNGQPLHTPTVLGTALFRGPSALAGSDIPVDVEMVIFFSFVHFLVFGLIGGVASRLLAVVEQEPNFGFGVVILFAVFEFGFVALAMVLAEEVLQVMAWPTILVGNTIAAAVMALYFRSRHPQLTILP